MSYLRSKPIAFGEPFTNYDEPLPYLCGVPSSVGAADSAIDAALRSVPLPDGLLSRLSRLVHSMPDEAADRMDYLGC